MMVGLFEEGQEDLGKDQDTSNLWGWQESYAIVKTTDKKANGEMSNLIQNNKNKVKTV